MLREKDRYSYPATQEYYIYTASDERIGVTYGHTSDSPTIWSIRDFGGNVLRQYKSYDLQDPRNQPNVMAWLWMEDYVYRDGQLLAAERVPEEGGRRHFHLDHLGSPRLVTGQDTKEMSEHDFDPFGLESNPQWQETAGGFDREDPKRFTGHDRDYAPPGESPASTVYLDYMHARFYSSNVGRFLSVDPLLGTASGPQSWNRYSYVRNNPIALTDPSGQCGESDSFIGPIQPCDATVTARNPSDLEYRMTMANIAAVENLHYSGMFLDWVARDLSAPFLMFAQTVHSGNPTPAALGLLSNAMVAMGPIDPEGEIAAAADAAKDGVEAGVVDATVHGAARLAGRGGADGAWTTTEIAATKAGIQTTQRGGAQVFVKEVAPGRFNVIVENHAGRVVTAMRNLSFKSVQRLGRNYGWGWP
jgi:RHS repeat-associated protein